MAESVLDGSATFAQFLDSQLQMVRDFMANPQIEKSASAPIQGARDVETFVIRYAADDGRRFVQRQICARRGRQVGVVTLTTLETEWAKVRPVFDRIAAGLALVTDSRS